MLRAPKLLALAMLLCGTLPVSSEPLNERMLNVFRQWVREYNFAGASIAIVQNGNIIGSAGHGSLSPSTRYGLASVAKSITGMCVAQLIEQGRLRYDTRLGDVFSRVFAQARGPRDARIRDITIQQLLTQVSGISDNMRVNNRHESTSRSIVQNAINGRLSNDPGDVYRYANLNYNILHVVVEEVTGRTYNDACSDLVFRPVGVRGAIPYGDPGVSALDFARFMRFYEPSTGLYRVPLGEWAKEATGNDWWYSIGVALHNPAGRTTSILHNGVVVGQSKKGPINYGAFFIYWPHKVGYFVNFTPNNDAARDALENRLWQASQPQAGDPPPTPVAGEMVPDTDLPGSDLRHFEVKEGDPRLCLKACRDDTRCRSYTYAHAQFSGANAYCWLKTAIPQTRISNCCVSGIVR